MPGDNFGELIGEFLESLLNPQPPGQGKPPGQGQQAQGQQGPGQLVVRPQVPGQGRPMGGGPRGPRQPRPAPRPSWSNDGSPFSQSFGAPPAPAPATQDASRRDVMTAEAVAEPVTGDDVAAHVDQYLDPKRVTARSDRFGEEVALADDHLDAHQRELFGQGPRSGLSASRLGTATAAAPTAPSARTVNCIAQDVAALVRSPQNIRAAFVLGEILRRPDW